MLGNNEKTFSEQDDELQLSVLENKHSLDNYKNDMYDTSNTLDKFTTEGNKNNVLPLANNFSDIDLSTCSNVQIGTRIITSNLTLIDQNKSTLGEIIKTEDPNFSSVSQSRSNDNDIFCQVACKNCLKKLWLKIIFAVILVFISTMIIIERFPINIQALTVNNEDDSTAFSSTTPIDITKWFYTRQEWGARPAEPCRKNLTATNQIKIITTHKSCHTFTSCRETMQSWQNDSVNIKYDLFFHYGISENGVIYEGLSTKCETRPVYRNCNETFLIIVMFFGSNICLYSDEIEMQVEGFNNLIQYNKDKGVLSNDSLVISISKSCFHKYFSKLNKMYPTINLYYWDTDDSC